jgi:hypothetical protein
MGCLVSSARQFWPRGSVPRRLILSAWGWDPLPGRQLPGRAGHKPNEHILPAPFFEYKYSFAVGAC